MIHDAKGLSDADMQEAQAIHNWLVSSAAPKEIEQVTSVFENDALRSTLISTDQTTMMMVVDFSVSSLDCRRQDSRPADSGLHDTESSESRSVSHR